jgi:hydroxymethylpyrimidine pyrophosphatase-like HAD family hydrolase
LCGGLFKRKMKHVVFDVDGCLIDKNYGLMGSGRPENAVIEVKEKVISKGKNGFLAPGKYIQGVIEYLQFLRRVT